MTGLTLDEAQRELLVALLDQLIPASADGCMPAAGALGIADFICDRAAADSELDALLRHGLAKAADLATAHDGHVDPTVVRQLEHEAPASFEALLRHTYMGYYIRGDIRALLGLSPKPVHPDGYDVPEQDLDQIKALTKPVKERGRCYRAV